MTAVAVVHNGQLWIAVWLVSGCIVGRRLNKTCALTVPDLSDPGEYPEVGVGIFRGPKVFASAKVRVYII